VVELAKLVCCGAINWDISLFVNRLPRLGEEVQVNRIERFSGGTAANVAVAAARILGPRKVAFIGALGDDEIGARQLETLKGEGVDTRGILVLPGEESGQAYITISEDGENEIHTYFGANLKLSSHHLAENCGEILDNADGCVIMDPPLGAAKTLAEICKEKGVRVIWDPGVYASQGLEPLKPTLKHTDILILNRLEYETLVGTSNPQRIYGKLKEHNPGLTIVVKQGEEGSSAYNQEGFIYAPPLPLEELGLQIMNTVGCGDAFIGGLAAGLVQGKSLRDAMIQGNVAGGLKATRYETRGSPHREELEKYLGAIKQP